MQMTFRWFGAQDPIPLAHIRQIPGVRGIVSALYDVPVGERWSDERLGPLADAIDRAGLRFSVVESIPVHEDVKLGRPTRDRLIENYAASIRAMGMFGIPVLCYQHGGSYGTHKLAKELHELGYHTGRTDIA